MRYISTRGTEKTSFSFMEALLNGLAGDGGLYVPSELPHFSREKIRSLQGLQYNDLAFEIIRPFVGSCIPGDTLKALIDSSYQSFRHPAIAPLRQLEGNLWVMELFHGPTLAFKDFALQLLGRLLDYALKQEGRRAIILGATSGDTGSAAIEGCRHSDHLDIVILHPHQCVSEIQRRQMTCVLAPNVHNIALKGNFDDCQEIVKQSFADQSFLPNGSRLVAVNSINWARIMAQIVYYFHAALALGAPDKELAFSVPTGNFGDIYAGYIARKMGLPVRILTVATNANNILHRFFAKNDYSRTPLQKTLAPSMDIMVSSNFERLLFDLYDRDGQAIRQVMGEFRATGRLPSDESIWQKASTLFCSHSSTDEAICRTMATLHKTTGYLADPHTSTAIHAIKAAPEEGIAQVALATAHPIKFLEAIEQAGLTPPPLPQAMAELLQQEERYTVLPNDPSAVHGYIQSMAI